ncbi:MAG: hypothetical protein RL328_2448, partial [Acidobacteriota bacterium]
MSTQTISTYVLPPSGTRSEAPLDILGAPTLVKLAATDTDN